PSLNTVYKLVEEETPQGPIGRFKLSRDKKTYPYAKQVWRQHGADGQFVADIIGRATESLPGEPLLVPVLKDGQLIRPLPTPHESRASCLSQRGRLPKSLLALERAPGYPVRISDELENELQRLIARSTGRTR